MSLQNFKNFTADRLGLEDLVALSAYGRALRAEYEALQVEEPEFISVQLNSLKREIHSREADSREARKRNIKAQLESLKTAAERKNELKKQLAELEAVGA